MTLCLSPDRLNASSRSYAYPHLLFAMPVVSDSSMGQLVASSTRSELLANLKQLKNAVIGNTWKKVEVADDEKTLHL